MTRQTKSNYWMLLLLLIVFFGPALAAWMFYQHRDTWRPHTLNRGELLSPPIQFETLKLKWRY